LTQDLNQEHNNTYEYKVAEEKWQRRWSEAKIFESDRIEDQEKYYINFPFPYINGAPHLGHGYSIMKADVMARFQRMLGKNVLFPLAFHATGEPIVGMAKRVKAGDKGQIRSLTMSGVDKKDVNKFVDPYYIVDYFKNKWIEAAKSLGLAIDWRRKFVTTQLTPIFSKFIEWQYRKLRKDGYVIQGSHPVIWCPADQNPTGDHDRLEGEGARVVDFVIIKFYLKKHNAYFLPGTLRPETVFGVTNMFVHPEADYVKVKIANEWFIISKGTMIKFEDQKHEIEEIVDIPTDDLIGAITKNPLTGEDVPVLPGEFIDAEGATGVVMSVPAHAPMDWIVLKQLKKNPEKLSKWGISEDILNKIEPISLIELDGYGEFPAGEAIDSFGITSMEDPKVKNATKLIYRKEHNSGILKEITGKYAGKSVSEVKDEIISDFVADNFAFILKEPGDVVVCRCGTRNHVKYLENQWFLRFGDQDWKDKTHSLIDRMDVFPKEARLAFHNTVDWLENKACARRSGLGTPLPWDTEWIVETLSDSVIYMAYYIISKYVNSGEFIEEYAIDDVFDYIMLKIGDPAAISASVNMSKEFLISIKDDLEYYYGFDLRTSGKDLLNNHLTYCLMHHTAVFPEEYWPKGMAVNGYVTFIKPGSEEALKMSKSKGIFETIADVIDTFGVDSTRLAFATSGEGFKDAQVIIAEGESYVKWMQFLFEQAFDKIDDTDELQIDRWLISRVQKQITKTRKQLAKMETRSAFQSAYHEIQQDIKWYIRRRGSKGPAFSYAIEIIVRLISPFVPHVIEEIWNQWGKDGFASTSEYPLANKELIDQNAEYGEKFLTSFMDDLKGLRRFLSEKGNPDPELIQVFIAPKWMYEVYMEAYINGLDNLIKRVMQNQAMRKIGKPVPKYCQDLIKAGGPPDYPWNYDLEKQSLNEAVFFMEGETASKIIILEAADSLHLKAKAAVPRRPGINFEIN
jgi:leucyl-tRNA synthetase